MKRLLLAVLLLALCAGRAPAETLAERYWRLHRERNATTRYGAPPTAATNSIPAGYRLLEYVESTGAQHVDTDVYGSMDLDFSVDFMPLEMTSSRGSGKGSIFGSRQDWNKNAYQLTTYNNVARMSGHFLCASNYGWSDSRTPYAEMSANVRCTIRKDGLVFTRADGTTATLTDQTFQTPHPIFVFAYETASGSAGERVKARLFSLRFSRSGVLVRDYIPAADTNGVAGLWDRVSGTMSYSATSTPLVAGPELRPATVLPTVSRETVREMLAPAPTGEPPELAGGDLWLDCLAIPEGNWLCECPIEGSTNTAWRAALCPSNILRAVVWRHAVGLAPTNLPVTLEHDPSRVIGRIERLFYEAGTGVVARISITQAGYAWAVSNHCTKPSPDTRCFTTGTNVAIRTDGWIHEHQDYIEARCVPRGEDMSSVTNVPAGVQAIVMAPVYLRGLSLVGTPLLPTYIEQRVPDHLRDVYPLRPPRQWDWRNGY
jgi:hypothetical protein